MADIGIPALRIISLSFPIAGCCIVLSNVFQALHKAAYSMLMTVLRQLVVLPAQRLAARPDAGLSDHLVCVPDCRAGQSDLQSFAVPFAVPPADSAGGGPCLTVGRYHDGRPWLPGNAEMPVSRTADG